MADQTRRILFVDDEPHVRGAIKRMLRAQRDEWDIQFAATAAEARERARVWAPDVIFTDIMMPVEDGLSLLASIRSDPQLSETPVVILTGSVEQDMKRRALDLGAVDLLNKPIVPEDLLSRIRSVLRIREQAKEIRRYSETLEERVRERTTQLEQSRAEIIWRLARAAEHRDEETGFHSLRVAHFSRALCRAIGASEIFTQQIFLASPLHDIGKIGIPDAILLKPGGLTPEERRVMQSHCVIGRRLLADSPAFTDDPAQPPAERSPLTVSNAILELAANIALRHHENWDGSGYPDGVAGEDIPLEARIVHVADVYDALSHDRPYRDALPEPGVHNYILASSGTLFDPEIAEAFDESRAEFLAIKERFVDTERDDGWRRELHHAISVSSEAA